MSHADQVGRSPGPSEQPAPPFERSKRSSYVACLLALLASTCNAAESSLVELEQRALRAAVDSVADSVVQIRTVGGLDRVGRTLLSQGPTSGLIVSADGYIVSSAYNFAGEPTSILVELSDGKQHAAELVARDTNRMLVLLKIETDETLPVPIPTPNEEMRVGAWAVAVGRTFQADNVGVSVGIISALNRMYGRVIQTDASVSVANYGGPLVDIHGRVLGVLVPMSPQASGGEGSELAGAEFYDSGIGFAVPLEHVLGILDRWKTGNDLLHGKLGIGLKSGDAHLTAAEITSIWPGSPADAAGWKPQDRVVAVDGVAIETQADLRFQIVPRYAGDVLQISLQRGDNQVDTELKLIGKLNPYRHAFLGVLPERTPQTEAEKGAAVRSMWSESPAILAGIEPGDRITKIADNEIESTSDAREALAGLHPGQEIDIIVQRGDDDLELTAKLTTLPESLPPATDRPAAEPPADEPKVEKLKVPEFSQEAVYYQPAVEEGQRLGLLLWLGDGDPEQDEHLLETWQATCRRDALVLLIAKPESPGSWKSDDLAYLSALQRTALRQFPVDRYRTVVAGHGKAGQLAYALALGRRSSLAGVIGVDAPLPRTQKVSATTPSRRLAVLGIASEDSHFGPLIHRDIAKLRESGYPVSTLSRPATNDILSPLDETTQAAVAHWIDGLDRY